MANILTIITAVLTALGIKIPNCLGTSDPAALQRYAAKMYNDRRDQYRPIAIQRVTNETLTAAGNQGKNLSYEDAAQTAHCILDSLRHGSPQAVAGVCSASAAGGVPETDPIATAAALAAVQFGVTVE